MVKVFIVRRLAADSMSIVSRWSDPCGAPLCYCLEPGFDRKPHPAIPVGTYPLGLRKAGSKHIAYKKHYDAQAQFGPDWHKGMVEICDVPDRVAILFHVGNTISDSAGCSLAGEKFLAPPGNGSGHYEVVRSRAAYEKVYPVLRDAVLAGSVFLEIQSIGAA